MKKILFACRLAMSFVAFSVAVRANDGAFISEGFNIRPVNQTDIEIRKEILTLRVDSDGERYMHADVYFEFFNPSAESKTLAVGFSAPAPCCPETGLIPDDSLLKDFKVSLNSDLLPYSIRRIGEERPRKSKFDFDMRPLAYMFEACFKPGINIVRHSYYYYGSVSENTCHNYAYVLQTGKRWAGGRIGDFELRIVFPGKHLAVIPSSLEKGKKINWKFEGRYRLYPKDIVADFNDCSDRHRYKFKILKTDSLVCVFKKKNFVPECDLYISIPLKNHEFFDSFAYSAAHRPLKFDKKYSRVLKLSDYEQINTPGDARKVYDYYCSVFDIPISDARSAAFYSQFFWYMPDDLPLDAKLSEYEREILDKIKSKFSE